MKNAIQVGIVTVCAVMLIPIGANADGDADHIPAMHAYFHGEVRGGNVLMGMGALGLGSGSLLLTRDGDVEKGVAYPLLGLGLVHAAAGVFVRVASKRRIGKFERAIAADPEAWARRERKRMRGVRKQFLALKIVETVLIGGGVAMAVVGDRQDRPVLQGIGIGLAVEAAATLLFDVFADRRAKRYLRRLGD